MFLQQRWLVRLPAAISSFVEYLFELLGVEIDASHAGSMRYTQLVEHLERTLLGLHVHGKGSALLRLVFC